ncbi:MAG TPA: hypothetical protein VGB68_07990 [Pyrinomonadaceae bacterium]|jgi:hypothetical protein
MSSGSNKQRRAGNREIGNYSNSTSFERTAAAKAPAPGSFMLEKGNGNSSPGLFCLKLREMPAAAFPVCD